MGEVLCGHHAVREALRAGRRRVWELFIAEGVKESGDVGEILRLAGTAGIEPRRVARRQLDELGGEAKHHGVAARVSPYPYADWPKIVASALSARQEQLPLLLLLDRLQDPQNLGSLLRTAEAVGVQGVAIPRHRAAQITPAVSSASAGAVEHLAIAQVTNMAQTIVALQQSGIWVVGLEHTPEARDYRQVDLGLPLALVVGSEGLGLSRLVRERCDFLIQLPILGRIGSLNAAVAGSIALYLAWQQQYRSRGDAFSNG